MPLQRQWDSLSRQTVGSAPQRYGVYELADSDGKLLEVGWGVLREELKDALAYSSGEQVRWVECQTEAEARELANGHRERADL